MNNNLNKDNNKIITNNLLNSLALLTNGRWYTSQTLDYTGKRTTKYTIEFDSPKEPDGSSADVFRSDNSNT
jgi:hypothetical protein